VAISAALMAIVLLATFITYPQNQPDPPLVIQNVTVIDMTGAPAKHGVTVLIEGGKIARIGRRLNAPPNAKRIDGSSKFLIPALWDMHVHVMDMDRMLPLFVANGVLGVRDMGSRDIDSILKWRDEAA
jgi:predicted amidohydrolase YtcJ